MRRFRNVLFVADSNGSGVAGIERAAALAVENEAKLSIVRVVENIPQELQFGVVALTPSELLETSTRRPWRSRRWPIMPVR